MENILITLNQHWPIFTAGACAISAALTWIIKQQYDNAEQDKLIGDHTKEIENLKKLDCEKGATLALINTRLAGIETDLKWIRRSLGGNKPPVD